MTNDLAITGREALGGLALLLITVVLIAFGAWLIDRIGIRIDTGRWRKDSAPTKLARPSTRLATKVDLESPLP